MSGRALMVQGTGSSVGKSVLCAALCRIFARRGVAVAPFKAQNMSNNAYVTVDGGEISRAQAVQAEAAGVAATVDMNPVLLKPEGALGSQVILSGRVWGRLRSSEFLSRKPLLWDAVEQSLRRLLTRYQLVIIEGAGSPAEVNLRAGDIVNMRVAEAADAAVLLVGDIDRGGVFASLVGTLELLEPAERERIAGFIINRFRGDLELLRAGLSFLEQKTGRPVLGVVPFLADLDLAEEDAATLDHRAGRKVANGAEAGADARLRVAAVRLPRLANYDDLDPLIRAGVEVSWIERPEQLGCPDLLVLPGSKNTAEDLSWLHETGLANSLVELADRGTPLLGICGGYQMLGEVVEDPGGAESDRRKMPGLGLMPGRTVLNSEKQVRRTSGQVIAGRGLLAGGAGIAVEGYEIHLGETVGSGSPLLELRNGGERRSDGCSARSGWIIGTYLHGILHNHRLTELLLRTVASRRAENWLPEPTSARAIVDPYERLADQVEAAIDLDQLLAVARLETLV